MKSAIVFVFACLLICELSRPAYADPADGLVAHYPFSGDANDAAGNGNHGVVYGATLTEDRFGNPDSAYRFDGVDDYIKVSNFPSIPSAVSLSAWVKRTSLDDLDYIINKGGDWTRNHTNFAFHLHGSSAVHIALGSCFAGGCRASSVPQDFAWHHYAVVEKHGDTDPLLYMDGELQPIAFRIGASTINLFSAVQDLHIGAQMDPPWYYYGEEKTIDDVRIYDRILTEPEIQQLFKEGISPEEMVEELVETVISLNLQEGISNSLDAKLRAAVSCLDDLNENNDIAAINSLNAFLNAVAAQRGNKISYEDADALIAEVLFIIDQLQTEG